MLVDVDKIYKLNNKDPDKYCKELGEAHCSLWNSRGNLGTLKWNALNQLNICINDELKSKDTNGHLIINQLIFNGKRYFSITLNVLNDDKAFINYLTSISKKNFNKLFKELPLVKYKEYRIKNGIYSSV